MVKWKSKIGVPACGKQLKSLITTFLIYPKPIENIHTIDELVESKLPIYIFPYYKSMLTTKLQDQYIFLKYDYFIPLMEGRISNGAYIVTIDFVIYWARNREFAGQLEKYHQVEEFPGTGYLTFLLTPNSPYRMLLRNSTLRSLAYGYFSKEWGVPNLMHSGAKHGPKKMELYHLKGVFLFWIIAIVLSVLVFVAEIFWHHYNRAPRMLEFIH